MSGVSLSLAKTATFAVAHMVVAFGVAYALTGSVVIASGIALIEPLAQTITFFLHERAWARVTGEPLDDTGLGHGCAPALVRARR